MNDELYHYGVKGMKWGKRTPRDIIKGLEGKRKRDKYKYIEGEIRNHIPSTSQGDTINKSRENKRNFKLNDSKTSYEIARQKAKKDPNYKNTDEYKSIKKEYSKQKTMKFIRELMAVQKSTSQRK